MRILQLTNKVPFPPRDGGAIASLTLAKELSKAGHEVIVLAMNTSKHFVDADTVESKPDWGIRWEIVPVNTEIRWTRALSNLFFSKLPYNAVRFISDAYRDRLVRLISEAPFDFIILENLYTALYLDDIRKATQTPVVLRAHNIEHEIWERTARSSAGLKRLYLTILAHRIRRFELSLINQYDALVPITDRDAAHFKQFGNSKPCHVLPTGMEVTSQATEHQMHHSVTIAHLGALDWMPNRNGLFWFLGQVWPIVRRELPGLEFHLAGRNAPNTFEARISAPGVCFHGEIPDAAEFIHQHTIFIVPLFSGSGMRIKLLDYLSAGKATVTTTVGAEGIPITDGLEAFIADSPQSFANHIITLVRNPALRDSIGKNAIDFVKENFNNQQLTHQFITFLQTIDRS